jgi:DNA-binding transcriptional regulator LsrR (DeoR family)
MSGRCLIMPDEAPPDARRSDERQLRKRDLAARAAWLYYVAGNTQDQLASKLNVSRQAAQRLVAAAVADGLITFRIDHPIRACIELEEALRIRFPLDYAEVVPGDADQDGVVGLGGAAARQLEAHLSPKVPTVLALGTGRTLRAAVNQVERMERPQHKVVSLVGTTTRDGRASAFDVVMQLADRIGAACYPVPTTVVTDTVEERALLESQRPWQLIRSLADGASVALVGIGTLNRQTEVPLLRDGFITETERDELIRLGAVGDITGWAFDAQGRQIEGGSNARLTAIPHRLPLERLTIGVAGGRSKARAIAGALRGRLVSGLITDEAAARRILELQTDQL